MFEGLKKAWHATKAGVLAVGAWIGEFVTTGDLSRANRQFERTYDQKRAEYSAGDRFGQSGASVVRGAAGVINDVEDLITGHESHTPTHDRQTSREANAREAAQAAQATEERHQAQAERRAVNATGRNEMRNKYGLKGHETVDQAALDRAQVKAKPKGFWQKLTGDKKAKAQTQTQERN